ncbi:MAG: glycosyltransferase, partial [Myxococcota bacterium]
MTNSIERDRLEAFVARHPEADTPVPPPSPQGVDAVKARLRAVGRSAFRAGSAGFWRMVRWVPSSVRGSPAAEPAKDALRWARRRWKRRPAKTRPVDQPFVDGVPSPAEATALRPIASKQHGRDPMPGGEAYPRVALAILTRNGAHHLESLFSSIETHWRYPQFEVWVVDHGSTDDTKQVVARHEKLDIRPIWLPDNHSFSSSTNRIAMATDAPLLLMLNNDIVFNEDVLHRMVDELRAPDVGMVGLRLFFPEHHADHPGGLQHAGIKFYTDGRGPLVRPYNLSAYSGIDTHDASAVEEVPAVTAACALVRRDEFLTLGGLDEGYNYGFEDIALSLRYRERGQKCVVVNDVAAIHDESATQKTDEGTGLRDRRLGNQKRLRDQFGRRLKQAFMRNKLQADRFESDEPLVGGCAVSEVGPDARAGDLFTAMELGTALEAAFGWRCRYLPRADGAWYDLREVDVIVGLVYGYDPRAIHHARPHLLRVGWVRNWFDRWVENSGFAHYDLVLSSSQAGADYILERADRAASVIPIASHPARFDQGQLDTALAADVVFTGSRWGVARAIEQNLQPDRVKGSVALYGAGWPEHPRLKTWARGFLPYDRMADVYASTKIVIDDCIEQCRPWGAMNSRVFDALASGALVVSNCAIGSEELFDGRLPVYNTPDELTALLN